MQLQAREILTRIYTSKEIDECISKVKPTYLQDDLKQHVFELLLRKPPVEIVELHSNDKLRNYIVKVIFNTIKFKEDKFHRATRRTTEIPTDNFECIVDEKEVDVLPEVLQAVSGIYWYNKQMLELYAEHGSYRAVADKTGIATRSVANAVQEAKRKVKKIIDL